jgi:hypothetical protein
MDAFEKTEMTTMTSCTNHLQKDGYTENFVVKAEGLIAPSTEKLYTPSEVKIASFYRFEGESDPADNAIVYAIETNDKVKGLLIDAYGGPYVNQKVGTFIKEVEEIEKKAHTHADPNKKEDHSDIDPKTRIDQNSNL